MGHGAEALDKQDALEHAGCGSRRSRRSCVRSGEGDVATLGDGIDAASGHDGADAALGHEVEREREEKVKEAECPR